MPSPSARARAAGSLLVFEVDPEGHSQEWLQHLIEHAVTGVSTVGLTIVAPPGLCRVLQHAIPAGAARDVRFLELTSQEQRACTLPVLSLAALARWWVMRRYLQRTGADCGFFLSLDFLCLPLALGLGAGAGRLAGILFRPSVHYDRGGALFRERLRDLRKNVLYRLMLRNPALHSVLSLDPFFPADAAIRYQRGCKVQPVVDPAPGRTVRTTPAVDDVAESQRIGFLLFGYLTERKGPLHVLRAAERLPSHIASRVSIDLVGRIDPAIAHRIDSLRQRLADLQPDLRVHVENRRLDQTELEARVRRCDVVLVPYQRFVGSSGVLLWAARFGRPVLAQDYGLVGRLTRENGLGLTADTSDTVALTDAMIRMVEGGPQSFTEQSAAQAFVDARTAQQFAATVFAAACPESDQETTRHRNLVTLLPSG